MRRQLSALVFGDALEIGVGTGANPFTYTRSVTSLTITDPNGWMLKRLKAPRTSPDAKHVSDAGPSRGSPFDDDSFDTVVSTLVLCGVDDLPWALRETRRALRPTDRLLFLQHIRVDDPTASPTLTPIEETGFDVGSLERTELPKTPSFVRAAIVGTATPRHHRSAAFGSYGSPHPLHNFNRKGIPPRPRCPNRGECLERRRSRRRRRSSRGSRRLDRQLCDDWPRPRPRPDAQSAPWRELFLSALGVRLERSAHRPIGRPGGDRRGRAFYMPPATHPQRKQAPSSCNSVPPTGWRPRRLPL